MRKKIHDRSKAVLDVIPHFSAVAPHTEWHFSCPETEIPPGILRPEPARGGLENNEPEEAAGIEKIDPNPLPPWRREAFSEVEIEPDRGIAIK
jgi:hypothetical protein